MNCFERLQNSQVLQRQLAGIWVRAIQNRFNIAPEATLIGLEALVGWGEDVEKISQEEWSQIYNWFRQEIRNNPELSREFEICNGFKYDE